MGTFLVTDTPQIVEPHHRVVVWLGKDHGPIAGKVVLHAKTESEFLRVAMEHVQPGLVENFECALTGDQGKMNALASFFLDRYKYASRQAHFDLNTLSWTYKICALQSFQKTAQLPDQIFMLDQLADRHRDESCVIIGAGPSVDIGRIDPRRILTIATSRTAVLCLEAGWCPDYIIHVDPDPFEQVRNKLLTFPLIEKAKWLIPFQVHHNFLDLPGRMYWFGSRLNPVSNWMAKQCVGRLRIPLIISGGSVSCCAFTIAEFMGCSPICLVGQDLSYLGGGKYFDNQMAHRFTSIVIDEPDRVFLPAIGGGKVETTMDYSTYAEWFVTQARNTRRKVINCTTRGVFLPGFEHTHIHNVYDRYCRQARQPKPDVSPHHYPRPDAASAVKRARSVCDQLRLHLKNENYPEAHALLKQMNHIDADGYLVTACTQYESKIMSYFSHLPPAHPQMKRCIEIMVDASCDGCARLDDALKGQVNVPDITESEVARRMKELSEINSLG